MPEELIQPDEQDALIKTSISLPNYLYQWVKSMARAPNFNSQSSVVIVALSEMKGRMEAKDELKKAQPIKQESAPSPTQYIELLIEAYLQTPEGRAILQKMSSNKSQGNTVNNPNNTNNSEILFENYYKGRRIIE